MTSLEKIIFGTALALTLSCNPKQEEQPLILKTSRGNYEVWEINAQSYVEKYYEKEPLTAHEVCPSVLNYFFNRPLRVGSSGQSESSYLEVTPIFPIGRYGQSRASLLVGSAKLSYVGTIKRSEDYEVCNL